MDGAPPPLDPEEIRRVAAVRVRLARAAQSDDFLPFDRFMEISLYDEEVGYYSQERPPIGSSGDFYTAPQVHPLFGRTVAARLLAIRNALGPDRPFGIFEVGPGDGALAASILAGLSGRSPNLAGISYHLIERSPPLARRAFERARVAGQTSGIPVVEDSAVGSDGLIEGVVIANELLDAQPARRLRWTGSEWQELGFRARDGGLEPAESPLVAAVPPPELPTPSEAGTVFEFSPSAEGWIRSVADHLARGVVILVDYGFEQSELLAAHPRGTLASVRRHRAVDRPEQVPGVSDLSVFVNFTRIREAARRAGLVELAYQSQAEALGAWGFPAELASAVGAARSGEEEVRVRLAAKNLLFGFERFRVLELAAPLSRDALGSLRQADG